jgi:hypothetical protein
MTDAISCTQRQQQVLPRSVMLAMAAAAAGTARDDSSSTQSALCGCTALAALPLSGTTMSMDLVLELDATSGALVFSSQLLQQRTAHLSCFVHSVGPVSVIRCSLVRSITS